MEFPIEVKSNISINGSNIIRSLIINSGLTTLVGPNGSGKTQLLRGLKNSFSAVTTKQVKFISAGRIGMLEQYRSDYDGHRGGHINFDAATFGDKGTQKRRFQIETLEGSFHALSQKPDVLIKVQERLRKLFHRNILLDWDAGMLKVLFENFETNSGAYSSGREASGLLHLVGILASLYDDEVGVLLLDEPEVSLHPQLQAFLLGEIRNVAGLPNNSDNKKIIIIATHSTEMIELHLPSELPTFVFCYNIETPPIQIARDAEELRSTKIKGLLARMGQDHKLALFAQKVLLVEGPSDSIICAGLDRKLSLFLQAAGTQILPVIGKGQFPVVVKLMQLLGKTPFILADADAMADNLELLNSLLNSPKANELANKLGSGSAYEMAKAIYSTFTQLVNSNWEEIKQHAENNIYWLVKTDEDDLQMVKKRSAFSTLFTLNGTELLNLDEKHQWTSIKERFECLIEILNKLGYFILRKGPIEAYYKASVPASSVEKPTTAVTEVEYFTPLSEAEVRQHYSEIIQCLEQSSKREVINEAEALRDLLLAALAPVLASTDNLTTEKANSTARFSVGDKAKLFNFSVINNGDNNPGVRVELNSKILLVDGIPFEIYYGEDLIKKVNSILKLDKRQLP